MIPNTSKVALAIACLSPALAWATLPSAEVVAKATLSNPSDFQRVDEAIFFDIDDLGLRTNDPRASQLIARLDGYTLPSQVIDDDGDGVFDRFMALLDFEPTESKSIEIVVDPVASQAHASPKRTQAEISHKVGGHWEERKYIGGDFVNVQSLTPPAAHTDHSFYIRYEGPGIESDRVGYRVYLDWRNGFDIFSKTDDRLALQNVGLDGFDSYHELSDWGMDTLKVGSAVGCGGFGYWNGEEIIRLSEVDGWDASVVQNGNILSSFKIKYKGWQVDNQKLDVSATLAMTAGSPLVKVDLLYSQMLSNIALGLVDHDVELIEGNRNVSNFGAWTYLATWGKQSLNEDLLGMAIFFRKGSLDETTKGKYNQVAVVGSKNDTYEYYFCSVWEKDTMGIASKEAFIEFLDQETEKLTIPIRRELVTSLDLINKSEPITSSIALDYAVKMAESEIARLGDGLALGNFDPVRGSYAKWTYTTGLLMQAIDDAAEAGNRADLRSYADRTIASFVEPDGTVTGFEPSKHNIDNINSGKYILRLWERTQDPKYKAAADNIRAQLLDHPRTSQGAFWHKAIYPGQLWLDGVYMGMPFLAEYSLLFEKGEHLKEAVHEFEIARQHLRDAKTGLYYHGWDESKEQDWANKGTGLSPEFWGRGFGWFAMALVDVMDFLPDSESKLRKSLTGIIEETADSLIAIQDPATGVWYQILDKPEAPGNYTESSASSMYVYLLAKAINQGYLPADGYKEAALKAYQGMIDQFIAFHADGTLSLKDVCEVAGLGFGRDGSYRYYMTEPVVDNDPKGTGPFIMASVEMSKLLAE